MSHILFDVSDMPQASNKTKTFRRIASNVDGFDEQSVIYYQGLVGYSDAPTDPNDPIVSNLIDTLDNNLGLNGVFHLDNDRNLTEM